MRQNGYKTISYTGSTWRRPERVRLSSTDIFVPEKVAKTFRFIPARPARLQDNESGNYSMQTSSDSQRSEGEIYITTGIRKGPWNTPAALHWHAPLIMDELSAESAKTSM